VHAVVDAFTAMSASTNGIVSKLIVTGPGTGGSRREVAMQQTAPGATKPISRSISTARSCCAPSTQGR